MDKADYGVAGIGLATYWQRRANTAFLRNRVISSAPKLLIGLVHPCRFALNFNYNAKIR